MDEPPGSRLFVVCGKSAEEAVLLEAFRSFGAVQNVKVIREKGVAYVKFDRASSAALAMEALHEAVLNGGRGPKIKVMLAESPNTRRGLLPLAPRPTSPPQELPLDPDNIPPRSRLFLVVPKSADGLLIEEEMGRFPDLQYCKTDLIANKGVVFCKYARASSALRAMEAVNETGMLAGYKVKCLLAEPKGKRNKAEGVLMGMEARQVAGRSEYGAMQNEPQLSPDFAGLVASLGAQKLEGMEGGMPGSYNTSLAALGLGMQGMSGMHDYNMRNALGALVGLDPLGGGAGLLSNLHNLTPQGGQMGSPYDLAAGPQPNYTSLAALEPQYSQGLDPLGGIGMHTMSSFAGLAAHSAPLASPSRMRQGEESRQRLFVVVHKGVNEEQLSSLFSCFPGMEYCDLKRDRVTGKSKGFCYVNYSSPAAAASAVEQLNGAEFPAQSGHRLKVTYAEPLGAGKQLGSSTSPGETRLSSPDASHPLSPLRPSPVSAAAQSQQQLASTLMQLNELELQGISDPVVAMQQQLAAQEAAAAAMHQHVHANAMAQEAAVLRSLQHALPEGMRGEQRSPDAGSAGGRGSVGAGVAGLELGSSPAALSAQNSFETATSAANYQEQAAAAAAAYQEQAAAAAAAYQEQVVGLSTPEPGGLGQGPGTSAGVGPSASGGGEGYVGKGYGGGGGGDWEARRGEDPGAAPEPAGPFSAEAGRPGSGVGVSRAGATPELDPRVVYTVLSRPLPDYALRHVLSQCGAVESVHLFSSDARYGAVRFASSEAAAAALALNGSEVLGEVLRVTRDDPLAAPPHTKRARVAQ